jgi:predicted RNase H-like nuclease (RuvC/YqgF family)
MAQECRYDDTSQVTTSLSQDKYDDLIEENKQLRKEIEFFCILLSSDYSNNTRSTSRVMDKSLNDDFVASVDHLAMINKDIYDTKSQLKQLQSQEKVWEDKVTTLQREVKQFQNHTHILASQLLTLSQELEEKNHAMLIMESDLLQILPLRLQVRDLENKQASDRMIIENLKSECLKNEFIVKELRSLELKLQNQSIYISELETLTSKGKEECVGSIHIY